MLSREAKQDLSPLQDLEIPVSKLDLNAPPKARKEYDTGYRLLSGGEYKEAMEHFAHATSVYPDFVAAHIALGSAYLGLRRDEQARVEFAKALALDDHLPISYLDLARAELGLQDYAAVEEAVRKASSIAPLDVQVLVALAYAQLLNGHYEAVIETTERVHSSAHEGAAIVHYYAAVAWERKHNPEGMKGEVQTLLKEDPKSPAAAEAQELLASVPEGGEGKARPSASYEGEPGALKADAISVEGLSAFQNPSVSMRWVERGWTFRSIVDEVAIVFAATDHGEAVRDLTPDDITIRDNGKPPARVTGFKNIAQLPLRLGLVIDTSESITSRFSFEQSAADNFMKRVVTGSDDTAFVVGFSNSILLVQDFTNNNSQISAAIDKLAPAGGTALWDAIEFAADKLADRFEEHPVARVLVVISDGLDNSSRSSLSHAIQAVVDHDVIFYAVSTRENLNLTSDAIKDSMREGDNALRTLAESTGGRVFFPGLIRNMKSSLTDLQQVIRSRYLVSYKPASFRPNNQYHSIAITAQKSGHKLRVYTRKGYYPR